jgi:hypothetical protein
MKKTAQANVVLWAKYWITRKPTKGGIKYFYLKRVGDENWEYRRKNEVSVCIFHQMLLTLQNMQSCPSLFLLFYNYTAIREFKEVHQFFVSKIYGAS